ncbi:hydrogenase maturation protease [Desulfogranum japonicum]|uniref:hydrogenase maturation protease n=1 Tax=Desulfogranum japonicum TaxID=231447 RepID=UPI00040A5ADA|nr:hydrogenase maturation protease [Desulfogranum japonicum]
MKCFTSETFSGKGIAPDVVIFGCGNIYLGDDGFGPAVANALNSDYNLPEKVEAIDAGTSIRDTLFDYLLAEELRPKHIIIVDSIDSENHIPGEVFCIDPGGISASKVHDFSLHQFPTVNMLQELQEFTEMKVSIIVAQISKPAREVSKGLSPEIKQAIPLACQVIMDMVLAA